MLPTVESAAEFQGKVVAALPPSVDSFATAVIANHVQTPEARFPLVYRKWEGSTGSDSSGGVMRKAAKVLQALVAGLKWVASPSRPLALGAPPAVTRVFDWHPHCSRYAVAVGDTVLLYSCRGTGRARAAGGRLSASTAVVQSAVHVKEAHLTARLRHSFQRSASVVAWCPMSEAMLAVATPHGICLWHAEASNPLDLDEAAPEDRDTGAGSWWMTFLRLDGVAPVTDLSWSPCGRWLAASCVNRASVTVWDIATRTPTVLSIPVLTAPHIALNHGTALLRWSPCSRFLLAGTTGPSVVLWDAHSGWASKVWEGLDAPVQSASWGPEGLLLLALAGCSELVVMSVATLESSDIVVGVDVGQDLVEYLEDRLPPRRQSRSKPRAAPAPAPAPAPPPSPPPASPPRTLMPPTDDDEDIRVLAPPVADDDDVFVVGEAAPQSLGRPRRSSSVDRDVLPVVGEEKAPESPTPAAAGDAGGHRVAGEAEEPALGDDEPPSDVVVREVVWDPTGERVCVAFDVPANHPRSSWCDVVAVYVAVSGGVLYLSGLLRGPDGGGPPRHLCFSPSYTGGALLTALYSGTGNTLVKSWPLLFSPSM